MWGLDGRTGHFSHTDVPTFHQLHPRVLVVDFPGSNSLDYHSKTFSVCGAINNLVVAVVPYTGDVSGTAAAELAAVFEVMRGAESSQVRMRNVFKELSEMFKNFCVKVKNQSQSTAM